MSTARTIKVFIASPGDLAVERRTFKDVIDALNTGFGRGANVLFEPLGWEDALSQVGRRSQNIINQDVDACDVFVLGMWRRWGQDAPDAGPYTSYTEEEFYRALARFERTGEPTIFVFFKYIDPGQMADPGEQLRKVLAFRKKLEETRKVLYRPFADEREFRSEIDTHLAAFAKGECKPVDGSRAVPILPDSVQAELEKHKAETQRALEEIERLKAEAKRAQQDAEKARAEAKDAAARSQAAEDLARAMAATEALTLAEDAAKAAVQGRIEEARQGFAKALDGTTNLRILYLGYSFFRRIGEIDEAERLVRRWLAISGPEAKTASTGAAYTNLGVILQTRGALEEAEEMHRRALAIDEALGEKEGRATKYSNLGLILHSRGDLDGAEAMHRKALEIDTAFGRDEGSAIRYGNLGNILNDRGDSAGAEAMYRKALELNEQLNRLEGVANQCVNLGILLKQSGKLDEAESMYRRALAIDEKLDRSEGLANVYGNLGGVLQSRGDLAGAEAMYRKSLAIETKLGRLEGMATDYNNLGSVFELRGELKRARESLLHALDLFGRLGAKTKVERLQVTIDRLAERET